MNFNNKNNLDLLEDELLSLWLDLTLNDFKKTWTIYESDIVYEFDQNFTWSKFWEDRVNAILTIKQLCLNLNVKYITIETEVKYKRDKIKYKIFDWLNNNILRLYLNDVSKIPPLIAKDEEYLTSETRKGNETAKQKLIESNLRHVITIAKSFLGYNVLFLDLIQEWNMWLIYASEKYNPDKWTRFQSYASWRIMQRIRNVIADNILINIWVPTHVADEIENYNKAYSLLFQKLWKEPTSKEIWQKLWYPFKKIKKLEELIFGNISLDRKVWNQWFSTLSDLIEDWNTLRPDELAERDAVRANIDLVLSLLSRKEERILRMKYWIDGPLYSFGAISEEFEFSQSRAGQIAKNAIKKLKEHQWLQKILGIEDDIEKMEDENIKRKRAKKAQKPPVKKKIEDNDDEFDFEGWDDDDDNSENHFPTDAEDDDFDIEVGE